MIDRYPQVYPPVQSLAELTARIESYRLEMSHFPRIYDHLTVDAVTLTENRLVLAYTAHGKRYDAHAYVVRAMGNATCAALVMPGTGPNNGTAVLMRRGPGHEGAVVSVLEQVCDVVIFVKPNEDFAAIHNGQTKLDFVAIYNELLNKGGSYAAHYLANALAITKALQQRYRSVAVVGLSQGGEAALLVAAQSHPTAAVVSSGYSVLRRSFSVGGHDQIVLPGFYATFDGAAALARATTTRFLVTLGQRDEWYYAYDVATDTTCGTLRRLPNVECRVHAGGHEYPLAEVEAFLRAMLP